MRNLKRALSLAVASVMLMGMMVVGSSASYADVAATDNVEAIEVLQEIGVMTGDENGDFNPDALVTRNEMAVVMANLLKLSVNDFAGTSNPFTDVPAWAQPYVTACYADSIIAGTSATTFGGSGNVTAVQAGLMVMKALGYFQYVEDFDEDWQLATVRQASNIDLYDGIDAGRTDALTRNEVAKLVLNALEATMVEFDGVRGTEVITSDGTTVRVGYQSKYSDRAARGSADYTVASGDDDDTRQLCEELYGNDLNKASGSDDFGRPATSWEYDSKPIGTYADSADATYTAKVSKGNLYDVVGRDIVNGIEDQSGYTVYLNGLDVTDTVDKADLFSRNSSAHIQANSNNLTGNGVLTEVYVDDSDAVTICVIYTYLAQVEGDYDEDDEELTIAAINDTTNALPDLASSTLSIDDFDNLDRFEDEDYVLITVAAVDPDDVDDDYEVKGIALAETATGEMTSNTKGSNVTVAGTRYSFAKAYGQSDSFNNGDDTVVYLDSYGYALYVDANAASDNYVYVSEFGTTGNLTTNSNVIAAAYFTDGTYSEITINNAYDEDGEEFTPNTTTDTDANAGWYTYSQRSNGKYNITAVAAADVRVGADRDGVVTTRGSATVTYKEGDSNTFRANNSTVFLLVDGDDVSLYTGIRNVPTVTTSSASVVAAVMDGSFADYVVIDVSDATTTGVSSSSDLVFILNHDSYDVTRDGEGDDYYTYDAIVNGEETTIIANSTSIFNADGLYTDVEYDGDDYVDAAVLVTDGGDYAALASGTYAVSYSGGVVTFGDEDFVLADSSTIYVIEADNSYDVNIVTGSRLASRYTGDTMTVFATLDDDGYVTALYVLRTTNN